MIELASTIFVLWIAWLVLVNILNLASTLFSGPSQYSGKPLDTPEILELRRKYPVKARDDYQGPSY